MTTNNEWHKTKDGPPEQERPVLIYCAPGDWYGVYWIEKAPPDDPVFLPNWWTNAKGDNWPADGVAITHWAYFTPADRGRQE